MAHVTATAVSTAETFEEFYEREDRAVLGLAYVLSGSRSAAGGAGRHRLSERPAARSFIIG